jgi:hypothetical protein
VVNIAAILIRFLRKCYGIKGNKNMCAEIIINGQLWAKTKIRNASILRVIKIHAQKQ